MKNLRRSRTTLVGAAGAGPRPASPAVRARRRARSAGAGLAGVLTLSLALTACGSDPEPQSSPSTTTASPSPSPTPTPTPEPEPEPQVWPLTGVESEEIENRPALAVKIENTPAARPQSGLESADVVWEEIVEFEVARLVAVYHSELPEAVGPIRSVRPMDTRIAEPLNGLLVFSGGQQGILQDVAESSLQSMSHDAADGGMYRISSRSAPHNVYGSPADLVALADAEHQDSPPEQFAFAAGAEEASAVVDGTEAEWIAVRLSSVARPTWEWDEESGTWLRSEGTAAATAASGERLSATNVVVVEVESFDSGYNAQGGAPVPDLALEGTGEALLATGGKTLEVVWSKESSTDPLVLETEDGEVVELAPGNTWVELMPEGPGGYEIG